MPHLLLGIDVGTSGARVMVFTGDLREVGAAQAPLTSEHPQPDRAEQDAAALWETVQSLVAAALARAGCAPDDLASVGITTQRSSVVIWERSSGEPVAPMVLWNDLRGMDRAAELRAGGHPVMPIAAAAKLEATLDAVPDGRRRAADGELAWGTLDSYLVHRLSGGRHITDRSCAWSSAYLDFFDPTRWNEALISHQGLPIDFFPSLCDTTGRLATTTVEAIGAEVPIGAVIADQQAGMFAHGTVDDGWKATYGTSGVLMIATGDTPDFRSGLVPMVLAGNGDRTSFAAEGMVRSAGEMLLWAVGEGMADSVQELVTLAGQAHDSGGVGIRPALHGLGTPYNDSTAEVALRGRTDHTTPAQTALAILESVAFRMCEIVDLTVTGHPVDPQAPLPVDGGLTRSDVFCQTQADLLGRLVIRHPQIEATVLGAALAGARGVGVEVAEPEAAGDLFEPTIDGHEAHERLRAWQAQVIDRPDG
jgi:glycerol kinase